MTATAAVQRREGERVPAAMAAFESAWAGRAEASGDAWAQLRERGWHAFAAAGLPTPRDEAWKYTRLRKLEKTAWKPAAPDPSRVLGRLAGLGLGDLTPHRLLFVDGALELRPDDLPAGCHITTLADAGDEVAGRLGSVANLDEHRFAALNTALATDATLIQLDADRHLDAPLYLMFVTTSGADGEALHPRVFIETGDNASVTVVEHYLSENDEGTTFVNPVTEIRAGAGSRVSHYLLLEENAATTHTGGLHVHQLRDSEVLTHSLALAGGITRRDLQVTLAEPGAHIRLDGLYVTGGKQHVDNHTRVDHRAPHTTSDEEYRGVLDGRSRAVFNGKAIVHQGAQKIDARQSNRNLLLSDKAEVDTKPELEIYADDVKCSHGATVGQLDPNQLFYLLSRGLDRETARTLLIFAFADTVLSRLKQPAIRAYAERAIAARLPGSDTLLELV